MNNFKVCENCKFEPVWKYDYNNDFIAYCKKVKNIYPWKIKIGNYLSYNKQTVYYNFMTPKMALIKLKKDDLYCEMFQEKE